MTDVKISALPSATALAGTELVEVVQGGVSKRTVASEFTQAVGWLNYEDAATAATPFAVPGTSVHTPLPNDALGALTNESFKPASVLSLWDEVAGQFDFTSLAIGDMVDIRVDLTVITTSPNQRVEVGAKMGIGGVEFVLVFADQEFKTPGNHGVFGYKGMAIFDNNARANPGDVGMLTDAPATVIVHGWYLKVTKAKT